MKRKPKLVYPQHSQRYGRLGTEQNQASQVRLLWFVDPERLGGFVVDNARAALRFYGILDSGHKKRRPRA